MNMHIYKGFLMKLKIFIIFVFTFVFSLALAQDNKESEAPPKTKIEQFSAKTGSVIIHGYEEIGLVTGKYGSSISVSSEEFIDAATQHCEYGITIDVVESQKNYDRRTCYIDYDEIDSLVEGINYISNINSTATELSMFQADYKTKDDLRISVFNDDKNKLAVAINSGKYSGKTAYFALLDLPRIKKMIIDAKLKIDNIK